MFKNRTVPPFIAVAVLAAGGALAGATLVAVAKEITMALGAVIGAALATWSWYRYDQD